MIPPTEESEFVHDMQAICSRLLKLNMNNLSLAAHEAIAAIQLPLEVVSHPGLSALMARVQKVAFYMGVAATILASREVAAHIQGDAERPPQ
jgi:hypothetical protein